MSRRIQVIEGEGDVPGFLPPPCRWYAPGRPLGTPEERTAALIGWVYASIRVDELTSGLVDAGGPDIAFAIREDGQDADDKPLFNTGIGSAKGGLTRRTVLDVEGERWQFEFRARPSPGLRDANILAPVVLSAGLLGSFFVTLLSFATSNARVRAEAIAETMTARLVRTNEELAQAAAQSRSLAERPPRPTSPRASSSRR